MSNDPWDGLSSGNFVKWETIGQEVVGDIIGKTTGEDLKGNKVPQLVIRLDDDTEVTIGGSQAQLKAKLLEGRPQVGDRIKIKLTEITRPAADKTLKHFDVVIKSGGAKNPVVTPAAAAAAADDF